MARIFICQYCNISFQDRKHRDRIFCSRLCQSKAIGIRHPVTCIVCGTVFQVILSRIKKAKCCSLKCNSKYKKTLPRKINPILSSQGYYFIKNPTHHRANKQGYVKIADLVMEKMLDRDLLPNEIVHHINHIRDDDSSENLELMDKVEHDRYHTRLRHRSGELKPPKRW